MKNTNLTINDRANMTAQQTALRIESGENIDPREEVVVVDATEDSIFADVDAGRSAEYGEHIVVLDSREVKKSVQIVRNGVLTETKPYVLLKFFDLHSGKIIEKKLYAGMVESLRRNINAQYDGIAEPMMTSAMLDFLKTHPISVWTRWNAQYGNVDVDFFDRAAWEARKAEESKVAADTRKGGKRRTAEDKATR